MATKQELETQLEKLRAHQTQELNASMKKIREKDIQRLEAELFAMDLIGDRRPDDQHGRKMHLKNQLSALQHQLSIESDAKQKQGIKNQIIAIQTELAALGEVVAVGGSADMQKRNGYNHVYDTNHPYAIHTNPWKNGPTFKR